MADDARDRVFVTPLDLLARPDNAAARTASTDRQDRRAGFT